MKLFPAFLRLIRFPNLFFIVLTQSLFYYCIIIPSFGYGNTPRGHMLETREFWLLSLSSVLIAAAGYIINDYFDLNIDRVNKPERMVVERIIKRRWTILWHWIFSGLGILIGIYVSWKLKNPIIAVSNLVCVVLLWFYSTTFKRKLLIGNVLVSLLTAWVIGVLYVCEFRLHRLVDENYRQPLSRIYKFALLYASFAFIISLIREVVKDLEDMGGDAHDGCRTMPIVWGVAVSKVFVATWIVILIAGLVAVQFYVLQYQWWWSVLYSVFGLMLPLALLLGRLRKAVAPADYHRLSNMIKMIMLCGILSMLFFKWYTSWIA